ncbi:MAG TPA: BadF/BadG/BcrA/BcrD ATPase family protein [Bryobacteraceae bacterium]|nr:BadF/BadG/BcrA/BcrD ATPase family protein [Bryobacteraceae bacterium]
MTEYFLGVDGGQSGATAAIGDESGRVLGVGRAGPSNNPGDPEAQSKFVEAITAALRAACASAGLDAATVRFSSACLGLSGGASGKEAILKRIIPADRLRVTDDADIALSGALAGKPGIVVAAGTGAIAFGRDAQGRTARSGGWGYLLGDEGGGFWIAREAIRTALRFEEGWGPSTVLRAMLLDATRSRNMNALMHRCYLPEFPRARIASLAFLVNAAAESGDPTARQILGDTARELVTLALAVRDQLFDPAEQVRCSHAGGVFRSRILRDNFRAGIGRQLGLEAVVPLYDGATGALLEAYRAAGLSLFRYSD